MSVDLKALVESDPRIGSVLRTIIETAYIERQRLEEVVNVPHGEIESLLSILSEKMVILELASQADSSVESRVPKKVYLINPELEQAVRELI